MDKSNRLMSLDALRGFDMWFITGGSALVMALCAAFGCKDCWLAQQMHHVPWAGFAHHDTIFPLFLFLAGVSWPFSYASQVAKGFSSTKIHLRVLKRTAVLFVFGLCYGSILRFNPDFRLSSVLGFIGLSWGISALLFMHIRRLGVRLGVLAALVFGYWALLRFGINPAAPVGADSYSKDWNIIAWFDRAIWPNHLLEKGVYDPESLLSIPGGVVMAMLGMTAGELLQGGKSAPARKALTLFGLSVASFAAWALFDCVLGDTMVKALWSVSFVFAAATYSFAMLALFYWIVDVKGWRGWTLYFRVIGMNSITIYMAQRIIGLGAARDFFFKGLADLAPGDWAGVVSAVGYLAVVWVFLYFLYRRQIFLRV